MSSTFFHGNLLFLMSCTGRQNKDLKSGTINPAAHRSMQHAGQKANFRRTKLWKQLDINVPFWNINRHGGPVSLSWGEEEEANVSGRNPPTENIGKDIFILFGFYCVAESLIFIIRRDLLFLSCNRRRCVFCVCATRRVRCGAEHRWMERRQKMN